MTEEEKKVITGEKHPGCVAQGHKLTALMKKRKEEILRSKEQSAEPSTEQSTKQPTEQSTEQSTVQSTEQSSVHLNDTMALVYLWSLPLVFVHFLHITLFIKNKPMKKRINHQNDILCFRKNCYN